MDKVSTTPGRTPQLWIVLIYDLHAGFFKSEMQVTDLLNV